NRQAGFLAGLPIPWILASVYVISGATAGLAGMIDAARILTGNPTAGQEYELQVIAAVVIGGASLNGGKGTIIGATAGALLMAVLQNGSNLLGISPFVQRMVIGALIIAAVGVDVWRNDARSSETCRDSGFGIRDSRLLVTTLDRVAQNSKPIDLYLNQIAR